ncbi:L-asparaginase II [Brevibacterium sp. 5221]|uniref:L-asparaginase II n=1 Tax=Brevibacterium rongguiense TaxID=2695267 RepID=A0A6N9H4X2_9MICO|nr:asparaginase [Brevibacterium rongguiense]MYM18826.1 L-asparaginase II [Brevibacterium rongguiense]
MSESPETTPAQAPGTAPGGAPAPRSTAPSAADGDPPRARATFDAGQAVELAVVERSGFIESRHLGSAVVVDPSGAPVVELGAPGEPVFTRSCLKPLQAIACMELGAPLSGDAAVLASASHRAEAEHVEVVERMLASVHVGERDLQCPSVQPADPDNLVAVRSGGRATSPLYFNCSGKHAAFLMAQKLAGEPTGDYLDPESAIQRRVGQVIKHYCGERSAAVGVDGCGAPVHALSLTGLARGIGAVAAGSTPEARTLMDAIQCSPWAIEGHGQPNTLAIEELGVLAKSGAEGVRVIATPTGWAVAVKCLDGSSRPTMFTALELLVAVGALDAADVLPILDDVTPPVTGGTRADGSTAIVGTLVAGEAVVAALREWAGRRAADAAGSGEPGSGQEGERS